MLDKNSANTKHVFPVSESIRLSEFVPLLLRTLVSSKKNSPPAVSLLNS